jgi:protoheme IX farnesyltransferase
MLLRGGAPWAQQRFHARAWACGWARSKASSAAAAVDVDAIGPVAVPLGDASSCAGTSGAVVSRAPKSAGALAKCYAQLGKARLTSLVVASSSCGFLLAGAPVDAKGLAAVTAGVALQSFAANTFNQVYEVRTDALMNRTRARPLPAGRISRAHAGVFGAANAVCGTALLAAFCNPVSAGLGAANILLYAGIYTPLKQQSVYNTHVGAVVGALPPLIGYAAATGTVSVEAGLLGAGLFFWQFPHFYALAYMYKHDYLLGGHKMMPCFDETGARTARSMIRNSVALSVLPLISYSLGITSIMFPIESLAFNGVLLYASYKFKADPSVGNARRVFKASLLYLPVFMGLMIFHKNGWSDDGHDAATAAAVALSKSSKETRGGNGDVITTVHVNTAPAPAPLTAAAPAGAAVSAVAPTPLAPVGWIEDRLAHAKAYMKSICVHEYLIKPPLARKTVPAVSPSTLEEQQTGIANVSLCPITAAGKLARSVA